MDYTMKTKNIIIIMAFLGMGFCACTDESEELLPLLGAEDVLVNKDAITELRSIRPMDTNAEGPIITNPGQKGRDHRDGTDYNGLFDLKSNGIMKRTIGSLYIEGYDEYTGEYILNFYWGDPISEETKKKFDNKCVRILYVHKYQNSIFNSHAQQGGVTWIPEILQYASYSSHSIPFFHLGDSFRLSEWDLLNCEFIVSKFCIDLTGHNPIELVQNVDDLFLDTYSK